MIDETLKEFWRIEANAQLDECEKLRAEATRLREAQSLPLNRCPNCAIPFPVTAEEACVTCGPIAALLDAAHQQADAALAEIARLERERNAVLAVCDEAIARCERLIGPPGRPGVNGVLDAERNLARAVKAVLDGPSGSGDFGSGTPVMLHGPKRVIDDPLADALAEIERLKEERDYEEPR